MDIAIISLLPGLIFLYLLKRHADRLEETDRKRIVDLLVVGYVMGSSGIISGSTNRAHTIAGGIIFIYGFPFFSTRASNKVLGSRWRVNDGIG